MALQVVSYGGGVQSTALLILAAQGHIAADAFLFANVGDDSENPETLAYLRDVARPFATDHGIELVELRRTGRDGKPFESLLTYLRGPKRSIPIPVWMAGGAPGTRQCTERWKIKVVADYAKTLGATAEDPADVALGISTDEIERARPGLDKALPWTRKVYPLLDLNLSRDDCRRIITDAGLPMAPKSACWFCPYTSQSVWRRRMQHEPELWEQAVDLDERIAAKRTELGRDRAYLHASLLPLAQAVDDQLQLTGVGDDCDSGYCFT